MGIDVAAIGPDRTDLYGVQFDPVTEADVVRQVMDALDRGNGGSVVTPNVDILRLAARDPEAADLVAGASLVVADGMPLVWASRLARRRLPARVAGSDLIWSLAQASAQAGHTIYLLGGEPGVPDRAAAVLQERYPQVRIAGTHSPPFGFDADPVAVSRVINEVRATKPDLVFVGLGFPRQERLIAALQTELPSAWFVGCGATIAFAAGAIPRAPRWMQLSGLEWLHRLAHEPRRLVSRYLRDDLPFALALMSWALRTRYRARKRRRS